MVGDLPQPDRNRRDEMPGLNYKMIAAMVVDLDYLKSVNDRWDTRRVTGRPKRCATRTQSPAGS